MFKHCVYITMLMVPLFLVAEASARPSWQKRPRKEIEVTDVNIEHKVLNVTDPTTSTDNRIEVYEVPASQLGGGLALKDYKLRGVESGPLALKECIRFALNRNRRLVAAGYDIEAAKGDLIRASALFWPVMKYKYRMAPVPNDVSDAFNKFFAGEVTFFNSIHIGIGMPVLTFGQLHTVKQMAQGGVEAARIKLEKVRHETIHQVKKIYYGIQFAHESIKLLGDAVGKLDNKIKNEEEKEEKDMSPYDILRLKIFKEELDKRLCEAKDNLDLAYDAMKILLDFEPEAKIQLESYQLVPVVHELGKEDKFIAKAIEHQPDARLLEIGVDTKRKQYKLEKLKLLPKGGFGFFVDVGRSTGFVRGLKLTDDFNDPFNYTRAGVGLQFEGNIDFHGSYGKIKKARAEYHKATYDRMIARRAMTTDVRKAYLNAKRMREEVKRAKRMESMARQMMFLSKINYDMGLEKEREKYADALQLVLLTRGKYFKTVYDYNMSYGELEKRIGQARFDQFVTDPGKPHYDVFDSYSDEDEGDYIYYEDDHVDMEGIENDDTKM